MKRIRIAATCARVEVFTPSIRARIVTIMPRVVVALGPKLLADVPFMRPFSEAYFTASAYQMPVFTSVNEEPVVGLSSFGASGFDGVVGSTGVGRFSFGISTCSTRISLQTEHFWPSVRPVDS